MHFHYIGILTFYYEPVGKHDSTMGCELSNIDDKTIGFYILLNINQKLLFTRAQTPQTTNVL